MLFGQSASWGVVLYDTAKEGDIGVLCYYEGDQPCYKTGKHPQSAESSETLPMLRCGKPTDRELSLLLPALKWILGAEETLPGK